MHELLGFGKPILLPYLTEKDGPLLLHFSPNQTSICMGMYLCSKALKSYFTLKIQPDFDVLIKHLFFFLRTKLSKLKIINIF